MSEECHVYTLPRTRNHRASTYSSSPRQTAQLIQKNRRGGGAKKRQVIESCKGGWLCRLLQKKMVEKIMGRIGWLQEG